MRGVFLHREDSRYDDRPAERYQFPRQYLSRASLFVGDWIVYYEPRRGPTRKGYYAIARVERIIPDPTAIDMYIALIEPGSYLPFERPVPFSDANGVVVLEFARVSSLAGRLHFDEADQCLVQLNCEVGPGVQLG